MLYLILIVISIISIIMLVRYTLILQPIIIGVQLTTHGPLATMA